MHDSVGQPAHRHRRAFRRRPDRGHFAPPGLALAAQRRWRLTANQAPICAPIVCRKNAVEPLPTLANAPEVTSVAQIELPSSIGKVSSERTPLVKASSASGLTW